MKILIDSAAVVAVLLAVLSIRLVIPVLNLLYRAIEAWFVPTDEPAPDSVAVTPIKSTAVGKPRATRKRRTSTMRPLRYKSLLLINVGEEVLPCLFKAITFLPLFQFSSLSGDLSIKVLPLYLCHLANGQLFVSTLAARPLPLSASTVAPLP
ncbi:hypothetical protein [Synechococcus sp. KORDI-52]|uniref:hypothetical protein n=1 Tax=Synechococcus sp. KORDI-52 TaxID=585425 RepID=UPI0012EC8B44|nr:hypothetical protein [Synechococcus sp. KORDI-52]